jgi:hypothetical protein
MKELFTTPSVKREPVPAAVLDVLRDESTGPSPQRVVSRFIRAVGFWRA